MFRVDRGREHLAPAACTHRPVSHFGLSEKVSPMPLRIKQVPIRRQMQEGAANGYGKIKQIHACTPLPSLEELVKVMTDSSEEVWGMLSRFLAEARGALSRYPFTWGPSGGHNVTAHRLWFREMHKYAPYIRRLGYSICLHVDGKARCTIYPPKSTKPPLMFELDRLKAFKSRAVSRKEQEQGQFLDKLLDRPGSWSDSEMRAYGAMPRAPSFDVMLNGTAPDQIRRRGLVKCVPRLFGWLRAARITLADPRRPGALERLADERAEAFAPQTTPPHWAKKEGEELQRKRKRELVDALHADTNDVAKGARWSHIHERVNQISSLEGPSYKMMRVEALAGDHFVFQVAGDVRYQRAEYEVKVLHRDEFDVEHQPCARVRETFEKEFANR